MTALAPLLFPPDATPVVPVADESRGYPVNRIFCVGRNYAEHAREMGFDVDRDAPWYFSKPANSIVLSGATIAYPPETKNYHYEMELVVAIGAPVFRVSVADAPRAVFGYACWIPGSLNRNEARPERWCFGKTPIQTFRDAIPMTKEKMIAA
jgi:2-keto-4-pentenoate hydratase/2-oxohepta-3-ene-1,7-dioic acid hydratase in catechol pathway